MLDELLLGGEVQETSKKNVLKAIAAQDLLQEVSTMCRRASPKPAWMVHGLQVCPWYTQVLSSWQFSQSVASSRMQVDLDSVVVVVS